MKYDITGTTMQILNVELDEGESVFTETGGMAWKSPNISMETSTKGGVGKALGRMFTGESFFFTDFTCDSGTGMVSFCNEFPGKIVKFDISSEKNIICQRDAFMVGGEGIEVKSEFTKRLGAAFFGGEGFFLQRIAGSGVAFLELAGEITEVELAADQALEVDPGYLAAFEPGVDYDIRRIKGLKNMFFGGEGLFLAHLQGPGKVWLQSMPLSNLAMKLYSKIPKKS